jgi:hypothetical protein
MLHCRATLESVYFGELLSVEAELSTVFVRCNECGGRVARDEVEMQMVDQRESFGQARRSRLKLT